MKKDDENAAERPGAAATLPAYDEGHVESVHEGAIPTEENAEEAGRLPEPTARKQEPKLSDQPDAFISSEVARDQDPRRTS